MADSFWTEPPIAIAHRGGAAAYGADKYRVENTIKTFSDAVKIGYEYLELDVIKSADDKVVVLHVASYKLEGLLGRKDAPSSVELQKMTHNELKKDLGREIPPLDALLKKFPNAKFFADVKTDEVVEPLAELIKKHKAHDRVVVGSFFPRRLAKAHEILGSKGRLNLNISKLPLKMLQDEHFLKSHKHIGSVHLPYNWASKRRVKRLQEQGLKVLVWTPNNQKRIKKAIANGADGIISDNIVLLKEVIGF